MSEELKEPASAVVGHLIKSAANDPQLKQAGHEFAGAVLTVAQAINVVLMPLAAVNFGFVKARAYFEERFGAELAEHTDSIPPEEVVMPKPSVAGPALQGLAWTHEEPDLRKMYLNLLASSMDGRRASNIHPGFVEVIKQLTSQEAQVLRLILRNPAPHGIAEVRTGAVDKGWLIMHPHLLGIRMDRSVEPKPPVDVSTMVDNWLRLGLVRLDYSTAISSGNTRDLAQGLIERTAFGIGFAEAVGIGGNDSPSMVSAPDTSAA